MITQVRSVSFTHFTLMIYSNMLASDSFFYEVLVSLVMQAKFGEESNTDSEEFFEDIAKFLNEFKKVSLELDAFKPR